MSDMGPENIEHKKIAIQGEEPLREWAKENTNSWPTIADEELVDALGRLVPEIDVIALNEHGMSTVWASSIRRSLQNGIDGYIDDTSLISYLNPHFDVENQSKLIFFLHH